jgi:hypothetical protein
MTIAKDAARFRLRMGVDVISLSAERAETSGACVNSPERFF